MPLSNVSTLPDNALPKSTTGIFNEALFQRLQTASQSEEVLIRESAKNVLEAEALLLEALEEMERSPLRTDNQ